MNISIKVTQIGNSLGVILPKDALAALKVAKGDSLILSEAPGGLLLTPYDPEVAATSAFGIAKNHPFVDGNKRAAFMAAGLFLRLNGVRLQADKAEAAMVTFDLAAGKITQSQFAEWLRRNS
jgi:putative addiction module antidote